MMLQPDTGPKVEPTIAVRRSLLDELRAELYLRWGEDSAAQSKPLDELQRGARMLAELDRLLAADGMTNDGKQSGAGAVEWRAS